jgi:aspartate-semialdehyde dehydrogenase
MKKLWNVALVGATGVVGEQLLECLVEREFPVALLRCLESGKGVGTILEVDGKPIPVEELRHDSFEGIEIAFFCAGSSVSREFCPSAVAAGAVCIDSSSAWRMDPEVPLVVPQVNPHRISDYRKKGIIAIPASSVTPLVIALKPVHDAVVIKRIVVSTYQAVSGTGRRAITELRSQVGELLNGRPVTCKVYPHQIAFNCLPQIDNFEPDGSTGEELMLINETRKIMEAEIGVTATAVRVPVFYGHSESINVETVSRLTATEAREILQSAPGLELVDDPVTGLYPMAVDAAGQDLVLVGRIREDGSIENGLNLWVVADNLRNGGAATALGVAETLVETYLN